MLSLMGCIVIIINRSHYCTDLYYFIYEAPTVLHMNKSFPHHPSQISTSVRRIHVSRSALTWREVTNARVVRDTSCCLGGDVLVRGCCATQFLCIYISTMLYSTHNKLCMNYVIMAQYKSLSIHRYQRVFGGSSGHICP